MKLFKSAITISLFVLISLVVFSKGFALETDTHELINERIASKIVDGFSLDMHLRKQLGIGKGIDEIFNKKTALEWVTKGGKYEDIPYWFMPYVRSVNHFHDPIDKQGYRGFWGTGIMSGISSVVWSQMSRGMQSKVSGNYSWFDARDYFYKALTSTNKTDRETNFAETFRGIGQLMHLVEDSSVPAHVRNEGHAGYNYEMWVKNKIGKNELAKLTPIGFDKSILNLPPYNSAITSITNIFDTNKYNGTNPNDTTGPFIGLSEYTNANFFSEGTIFRNYPHPAYNETTYPNIDWKHPEVADAEDGKFDNRIYIRKTVGEVDDLRLASVSYVSYECFKKGKYDFSPLVLDDNVYKDYAALLIPRAVGYSAGLLNYFFRGKIEITPPSQYVYSIIDGSVNPQQFTKIKAKLRNMTPGEAMQAGTLIAVAKYKQRTDYQPDLSTDPPSTWDQIGDEYHYSVSVPRDIAALSSTGAQEFAFDFTNNPIPAGITDLSLQIVFKGTLGNEKDNAVAVGWKDLLEPTHHVFWNLTDRFSILDPSDSQFHLKTGDEIRADAELLAIVNEPPKANIDPFDTSFEIAYAGTSSAVSAVPSAYATLHPGNYIRLILLVEKRSDTNDFHDSRVHYVKFINRNTIETGSTSTIATFLGSYNQETLTDNGMKFYYTYTHTFRTITDHFQAGVLRCRPYAVQQTTGQHECPYNDAEVTTPPGLAPIEADILY